MVASRYRPAHAIHVREGATEAAVYRVEIPAQRSRYLLSVRALDDAAMMVEADEIDGADGDAVARRLLDRPEIAYLHAHNARPGCFAARIDRI